jgi:hypothetical protein
VNIDDCSRTAQQELHPVPSHRRVALAPAHQQVSFRLMCGRAISRPKPRASQIKVVCGMVSHHGCCSSDRSRAEARDNQSQQPQMVRSLAALAICTVLGASVIAVPGFTPKVEASEPAVLAKADWLVVRTASEHCRHPLAESKSLGR